jgi:RNA polymerase sigma-70 factor (ECF subfamily)
MALSRAFLDAAGCHCDDPGLEELLKQRVKEAHAAWPDVPLADKHFARALAVGVESDVMAHLSRLHAGDLYLAAACAQGDETAIEHFEQQFLARVPAIVRRIERGEAAIDEIQQTLRARLLVGDGKGPKIAEYSGRGPLSGWLRVAATNEALMLKRKREVPHPSRELQARIIGSRIDPEGAILRERHRDQFQAALDESLRALAPKERNLLRAYFIDEMTVAQLGVRFNVHTATAARWVQSARQTLLDETRRRLGEKVRLTKSEFNSLARLLKSELEISFSRPSR